MLAIDFADDEYTEFGLPFRSPVPEADRCTGFFATGGGVFFDKDEACDEALLGRLAGRDGEDWPVEVSLLILVILVLVGGGLADSNGGGSLRGVSMRPLGSVAVDATDEAVDWYDSILPGLETVTQSGSSEGTNGFDGRFGLGTAPL
jgi:hypothetical protein